MGSQPERSLHKAPIVNQFARKRAHDEYKQRALELWRASNRSADKAAPELVILPPLLHG
jgi:hypothetical protein